MPSRFDPPSDPKLPSLENTPIDTDKRYDVYCSQWQHRIVLFRNALFRRTRDLYRMSQFDPFCEYIELEQTNGHVAFVKSSSIIMFCEPGTELSMETVSSK